MNNINLGMSTLTETKRRLVRALVIALEDLTVLNFEVIFPIWDCHYIWLISSLASRLQDENQVLVLHLQI